MSITDIPIYLWPVITVGVMSAKKISITDDASTPPQSAVDQQSAAEEEEGVRVSAG